MAAAAAPGGAIVAVVFTPAAAAALRTKEPQVAVPLPAAGPSFCRDVVAAAVAAAPRSAEFAASAPESTPPPDAAKFALRGLCHRPMGVPPSVPVAVGPDGAPLRPLAGLASLSAVCALATEAADATHTIGGRIPSVPRCPGGHRLVRVTDTPCVHCKKKVNISDMAYHCGVCDELVCRNCADVDGNRGCRAGHSLGRLCNNSCDGCSRRVVLGLGFRRCHQCDHDQCHRCLPEPGAEGAGAGRAGGGRASGEPVCAAMAAIYHAIAERIRVPDARYFNHPAVVEKGSSFPDTISQAIRDALPSTVWNFARDLLLTADDQADEMAEWFSANELEDD